MTIDAHVGVEALARAARLSNGRLIERFESLVLSTRRLTVDLVVHLSEVEERRLHLESGFPSLFTYCVTRFGMSEDEAYRRITVARLGRRFPAVLSLLASGQLSLTTAALLKPHLSGTNAEELLHAVSGKSVQATREVLAARFPVPNAPSVVRKLPEPRSGFVIVPKQEGIVACSVASACAHPAGQNALDRASAASGNVTGQGSASSAAGTDLLLAARTCVPADPALGGQRGAGGHAPQAVTCSERSHAAERRARVEPSAEGRYRVQFSAGTALKQKLELARDWMRHRNPSGEFAPIIEDALDLLLEKLEKQRFGKIDRARQHRRSDATPSHRVPEKPPIADATPPRTAPENPPTTRANRLRAARGRDRILNATRREVAARDGRRCCFEGPDGRRCDSRAFLEYDHRVPRGRGGGADAENLRLYCRAHNRLAAELVYGRKVVDAAIARRRAGTDAALPLARSAR